MNKKTIQKYASEDELIFNALNIGVFEYMTNKKEMRFLRVNQFGCELFNFENHEDFLNYDWTLPEVCHPDEVDYLFEEMNHMNQVGDLAEHEYRLNRHNGLYVWVLCHQKVIDQHGEWLTILNSCTVINEKKWAEEANAAKSAFISNMSHDMRTPLNAIINLAVLAKDNIEHPEKILNDLGEIELAGTYLLSLVNDVLDMNKIENRELQFTPEVYRCEEFYDYVNSIITPLCRDKGIEFICNKGTARQPLWVDKTRFNQIFFNLLSNAAKYTEPGGTVIFSVTEKEASHGTMECSYIIADNGIGMKHEFQKRMFEPFEREERSSAYTGTGLGLTIVKEIIEAMDGNIEIESEYGIGTTVHVQLKLPIATDEQLKTAFPEKNISNTSTDILYDSDEPEQKGRILIVEDNSLNHEILVRILEKRGYSADVVTNGKYAVERISECRPWEYQAILMDIRMPVMDGLTATRLIRRLGTDYSKNVPVIAMTANAYADDIQASFSAGMNAHLSKPVEPELLFHTLEKHRTHKSVHLIKSLIPQSPVLQSMARAEEIVWINPDLEPGSGSYSTLSIQDIYDASLRLFRFSPLIMKYFPETAGSNGIIESQLIEIPAMKKRIGEKYSSHLDGRLLLKLDSHLPVSGSVKARGGIYEVLKHTEELALEHGLIKPGDDYIHLTDSECRNFFGRHTIQVGSTGNLGMSIGIMSAAIGFNSIVHMSADAREWKKELLRKHGVTVIEYDSDYTEAVRNGRRLSDENKMSYFIDDENSRDLFLGYAVAAVRLLPQLAELGVTVDENHPLFVYIPCGIGGAPGGITFGLKQVFGRNVHCFFAEPVQAPCMALGMISGLNSDVCVQDIGLTGKTAADGLAVGRPSGFVGKVMKPLLSGEFTIDDSDLYHYMRDLLDSENIFIEPSACAAFKGIVKFPQSEQIKKYLDEHQLTDKMEHATHICWATGGSLVPDDIRNEYLDTGL